jgi:hypothetical protein
MAKYSVATTLNGTIMTGRTAAITTKLVRNQPTDAIACRKKKKINGAVRDW